MFAFGRGGGGRREERVGGNYDILDRYTCVLEAGHANEVYLQVGMKGGLPEGGAGGEV